MEQKAKEAASHAAIPVSISAMLVTLGVVYGDIGTSPMYVTKALVAGNGGIGSVTEEFVRRDLEQGSIRVLKTDFEIPSRTVDMCTLREVSPTAAASRFIEMVQESTKKG